MEPGSGDKPQAEWVTIDAPTDAVPGHDVVPGLAPITTLRLRLLWTALACRHRPSASGWRRTSSRVYAVPVYVLVCRSLLPELGGHQPPRLSWGISRVRER